MSRRFSIIIPAYNEAETIGRAVVETVKAFTGFHHPFEVIIVDDGSTDETSAVVDQVLGQEPHVKKITHTTNLGKGAAVKTGALAARGEWILFLDADLSVMPASFRTFLPHLETADVLMGSRRVIGSRILDPQPWYRDGIGRLFNFCVRWYLRLPYRDTQCGFKAFRLSSCRTLFEALATTGWTFDVELLLRARKANLRIQELPVEWHDGPKSRVKPQHAWDIMKEIVSLKRRLRG